MNGMRGYVLMGLYIYTFAFLKDDIPDEECKPAPKKPATAVSKSGNKAAISSKENTQDDGGSKYMDVEALLLRLAVAAKYHSGYGERSYSKETNCLDDAAFTDSDTSSGTLFGCVMVSWRPGVEDVEWVIEDSPKSLLFD
ncbi:hypothetical protein Tco_1201313 [Tanacetum coccineum]